MYWIVESLSNKLLNHWLNYITQMNNLVVQTQQIVLVVYMLIWIKKNDNIKESRE